MMIRHKHFPVIVAGFISLILAAALFSVAHDADTWRNERDAAREQLIILDGQSLRAAHLERIYNLSIEFGFDPLIVELVSEEAGRLIKEKGEEWRLIQNPEYLTYLMLSIIAVESNGNTWAVGDKGKARGLTQIWTTTAKSYQEDITAEALLNPQINIELSFKHFHELLKKYHGNFGLVLYAWNRGSGKVDNLLAYGRAVENGYGRKVYAAALNQNREIFND